MANIVVDAVQVFKVGKLCKVNGLHEAVVKSFFFITVTVVIAIVIQDDSFVEVIAFSIAGGKAVVIVAVKIDAFVSLDGPGAGGFYIQQLLWLLVMVVMMYLWVAVFVPIRVLSIIVHILRVLQTAGFFETKSQMEVVFITKVTHVSGDEVFV